MHDIVYELMAQLIVRLTRDRKIRGSIPKVDKNFEHHACRMH